MSDYLDLARPVRSPVRNPLASKLSVDPEKVGTFLFRDENWSPSKNVDPIEKRPPPVDGRAVGYIYKMYHEGFGHLYIGQTKTLPSVRFGAHKSSLGRPYRLYSFMRTFGFDSMVIEPLEMMHAENLDDMEDWYIKTYHPELNTSGRIDCIGDLGDGLRMIRAAYVGYDEPPIEQRREELTILRTRRELGPSDFGYLSYSQLAALEPEWTKYVRHI